MILANVITLARLPLLVVILAILLRAATWPWHILGLALLGILFLMDCFDGYVARWRREATAVGAVLDIALDRVVENVLWIAFMHMGLVAFWVPVVFLVRSFVVDGVRGVALTHGKPGFSMMHSAWGRFLVSSRFMRAFYGLAKWAAFTGLWLTHVLSWQHPVALAWCQPGTRVLVWLAVGLCVARGLPVLVDGRLYFQDDSRPPAHRL